jgi:Flp pilus assembly protein TadD
VGTTNSVSFLPVLVLCALAAGSARGDALSDAVAALERGDFLSAEQALRLELRTQPNNTTALSLLGVALDNEKKYAEAHAVYRRAIALSPRLAGLLNNYGNHLLATGDTAGARAAFLKVVALNPAHANANRQLARMATQKKAGSEALQYLDRLPANEQANTETTILRVQALFESDRNAEGEAVLERLSSEAQQDARLSFSVGLALATAGQYAKAETFFSRTLELMPADFDALYNLGLAASHAGHNERAHNVLLAALEQHPQDIDVIYNLAAVNAALKQNVEAVRLLAQAVKLAPQRADIELLLAHTTFDLGALADSLSAWDRYRELVPGDDVAGRERGFVAALLGRRTEGISSLSRTYASIRTTRWGITNSL